MNRRELLAAAAFCAASPAFARNAADFPAFIQTFRQPAQAAGVSAATFELGRVKSCARSCTHRKARGAG